MTPDELTLTTVTLTDRERRVIYRSLALNAKVLYVLGDDSLASGALELAARVLPEGDD